MKAGSLGLLTIALAVTSCGTFNPPSGTMAGHNTTLPAQPACLIFCFAEVRSSIDTPPPSAMTKNKQGKTAPAPVIVPPPVINTAPAQKPPPTAPIPDGSRP
ncbi:hypothetical protein AWB80_02898 [Caballeronia pedi]|uniref:Lipoprotein n=1 Tax=Caballeronia pedi TaxID=1777141 RepID=A0A158B0B4_9BURK|nr:hypothetical protein [Caballeronia pedi]SAK63668.1 hypothetical protein AWB80_02898 [Caballeronia pedi]